ncbi:MAG TPA: AraC family ligand binding domain-containing protein, partial [Candidatus Methylacidiphilales bacterium]|nr:AraC family ligand binding domain-containing protein [Candidatus Methylacidiphilales bacterium]
MATVPLWTSPLPLRLVTFSNDHRSSRRAQHLHLFYELALVSGGRCLWQLGTRQRRVLLNSGEALLLPPRVLHREVVSPGEKARVAWLGFDFGGMAPGWCQRPIPLGEDASEITGYFEAIAREHHLADPRSQMRIGLALQSLLLLLERCAEGS